MKNIVKNVLEAHLKVELDIEQTELKGKRYAVSVSSIPLNTLESDQDLLSLLRKELLKHFPKRTVALSIFNFNRNVRNYRYKPSFVRSMH